MVSVQGLIDYIGKLAVDDDPCQWPVETRLCIINEAVLALSLARPEQFSDVVDLMPTDAGYFELSNDHGQFLSVQGYKEQGQFIPCHSLSSQSMMAANDDNACWRCNDESASNFVWSPQDPRRIYVDGSLPEGSVLTVTVSGCPAEVGANDSIDMPKFLRPQLMEWILYRVYERLDSAVGKQGLHFSAWDRLGLIGMNTVNAKGPMN